MAEMVDGVKLMRYKIGLQQARVRQHTLFGTMVPKTCTELDLKEWSASYYYYIRIFYKHKYTNIFLRTYVFAFRRI